MPNSPRSFAPLYLSLLLCCGIIPATPLHAEEVDVERFERTTVYSDLTQPMELEIAPDGSIFLIEIAGLVKRIDPQTGQATIVGKLEVTTAQENGLIGMALDPNFAENGWIYLQYSPPEFSGQHISRFDFRDGQIDLASEKLMFKYEEQRRECCHHAGSMEFGPDGNLFIGTGDNTNPFKDSQGFAPIDERENREPWDAQRSAGNTKSYNGKVLRIRPEPDGSYSIPDGNLFPKDGSIGHPEIYVMGCRNPWRISVDQKTGYLYWGDVGPDAGSDNDRGPRGYDEVNQARAAGNFGWPYFIGNNFAYPMVDFASGEIHAAQDPRKPINESVNNTGSKELPPAQPAMIYYPAAPSPEFPEVASGGRTACAGPVYHYDAQSKSTTKFPAAYDGTLFAFEWSRHWIMAVHMDKDSNVQRLEPFLPEMKFARPIDLQFDAAGALYVIEYGETWGVNPDARLVRIDYVRGNRSPVAVASAESTVGREPLIVKLSAADSYDKDGDSLTYQWSSVRSGVTPPVRKPIATTAEAEASFAEPGVYTIELTVTDPSGASNSMSLPVIVGNARPEVKFLEPQNGDFFSPGKPIRYRLQVRDIEDGTSDFDEAEEEGWHLIEGLAPTRLFVEASAVADEGAAANVPPGLALIRKSDCLNCHAANRRLVGPSFVEIATKYRDQPHEIEKSVARVRQGSTGVWGKIGMLPHQQHTEAEVLQMVQYVYAATADSSAPTAQGFNNELLAIETPGKMRLEATYTDLGRDEIPKLIGTAEVVLRSRNMQAESADEISGARELGSGKAEGKKFIGAINHDAFLKFNDIPLDAIASIAVRVTSAGAGGMIEVRRGTVDGPLLGSAMVEVNGSWDAFEEKQIAIDPSSGRDALFIVFKNEKQRGGLMNIDSLRLE
ncbi:PQQ-dependent sugar dehydrogenase [Rosistilla oblonga]|uniref:PQQ-dependent sugar dehydrogenase n=1 Tax=Rosistilla oblonga TaxID=2527990 RepID=UPI003A97D3DD